MGKHTILLYSFGNQKKNYNDFPTVSQALDGICKLYEGKLKAQNPNARSYSYDIKDLNRYIDELNDLGMLIFNPKIAAYEPRNKDYIKERILRHLQEIATGGRGMQQ
eukprot:TRINITY_DN5136_c0_g1_i2.p2 TRINITY_DN5136_c0_g1~~TRINITY_DN5136_c0_g1_i2.p2  ORF type:complete len:107 (+),score=39.54 TRINITY_DN5136_c0_g1_i2:364-684(+)